MAKKNKKSKLIKAKNKKESNVQKNLQIKNDLKLIK